VQRAERVAKSAPCDKSGFVLPAGFAVAGLFVAGLFEAGLEAGQGVADVPCFLRISGHFPGGFRVLEVGDMTRLAQSEGNTMIRLTTCLATFALLIVLSSTAEAQTAFGVGTPNFSLFLGSGGYAAYGGYPAYGSYYGVAPHCAPRWYPSYRWAPPYAWYGNGYRGPGRHHHHHGHNRPHGRGLLLVIGWCWV
jgi:hypothetical protein